MSKKIILVIFLSFLNIKKNECVWEKKYFYDRWNGEYYYKDIYVPSAYVVPAYITNEKEYIYRGGVLEAVVCIAVIPFLFLCTLYDGKIEQKKLMNNEKQLDKIVRALKRMLIKKSNEMKVFFNFSENVSTLYEVKKIYKNNERFMSLDLKEKFDNIISFVRYTIQNDNDFFIIKNMINNMNMEQEFQNNFLNEIIINYILFNNDFMVQYAL